MFNKKRKDIEAINERLDRLEASTGILPVIERIEGHLSQIIEKTDVNSERTECQDANSSKEYDIMSEERKLQAAYALNLCTVSVSQIVEYNDLYVLEQEYEGILNNLNLENIPHDDVLLKILKQLLDTITFFRIQEGDKRFIEEEYKQKTKSAIWSAVPNLSVILATGNPYAMVGALVAQVGIGYMNYRKEKAKIGFEHEKELWQLQRSAIEQINALRRELFATAWKLADKYGFKDSYRLTERQITLYNQILMDPDPFRRYERLKNISDAFSAYPNFHFYIGDAASDIAGDQKRPQYIQEYFKQLAIDHFRNFNKLTSKSILRIDPVNSASCLKLAGLLDPVKDKDEIKRCLNTAAEKAGIALDVLQLCALGFLRINETGEAGRLLRMLCVEGYNVDVNASLLSMLYFQSFTSTEDATQKTDIRNQHMTLSWIAPSAVLLPLPESNSDEAKKAAEESFLRSKADVLIDASFEMVDKLVQKYSAEFNRMFLNPHPGANLPDEYFMDSEEWVSDLNAVFNRKTKKKDFLSIFYSGEYDYYEGILDQINKLDRTLQVLPPLADLNSHILMGMPDYSAGVSEEEQKEKNDLEIINGKLLDIRNKVRTIENLIYEGKYDQISIKDIFDISVSKILTSEYDTVVTQRAGMYVDELINNDKAAAKFNEYENILGNICNKEHIEISLGKKIRQDSYPLNTRFSRRIGAELYDAKSPRIRKCIKNWFNSLDEDKKKKIRLYESGTEAFTDRWNSFRKEGCMINPPFGVNSLHAIIVSFDNQHDLFLTTDKLYYRVFMGILRKDVVNAIPYSELFSSEGNVREKVFEDSLGKARTSFIFETSTDELLKEISRIQESRDQSR